MNQLFWVIGIGLLAAAPGIASLIIGRRRSAVEQARPSASARDGLLAQLQEQVVAQQKTIRFLTERVDDLEAAREREYGETEALREEAEALRQEVRELRSGVQTLIGQMEKERLTPVWRPDDRSPAPPRRRPADGAVTALHTTLSTAFSREEIDDMAFRLLGVESDLITGETKKARARSLIQYLTNRGRLNELEVLVSQERH